MPPICYAYGGCPRTDLLIVDAPTRYVYSGYPRPAMFMVEAHDLLRLWWMPRPDMLIVTAPTRYGYIECLGPICL